VSRRDQFIRTLESSPCLAGRVLSLQTEAWDAQNFALLPNLEDFQCDRDIFRPDEIPTVLDIKLKLQSLRIINPSPSRTWLSYRLGTPETFEGIIDASYLR